MTQTAGNKHADRSAQTRERFIHAAQQLFAERSIDSVSLNEITVAAGQKNRNALQYHFGNREGLLQAIIDTHAVRVRELRQHYLNNTVTTQRHGAGVAARALIKPLAVYIEENPCATYYVKILSQLAALNSTILNPAAASGINFQHDEHLEQLLRKALGHLKPAEAKRRMFLIVSITFHSIADICRACESSDASPTLKHRELMFEQTTLAVESLLAAPAIEAQAVSP
jgi:AcrR family transcriptional regulator